MYLKNLVTIGEPEFKTCNALKVNKTKASWI
jgi:hypothetical protein